MIAELKAMATALAPVGVPVHIGDATGAYPPFIVLWGSPATGDRDESAAGPVGAWTAPCGVTCTGQDAEAALTLAESVRGVLAPTMTPTALAGVTGRHVVLELTDARSVQVDRTVTLTSTNTHPALVVLLLDVHSQPA